MNHHRCDTCRHVDMVRGIHPMRCQHPQLRLSLPCECMRASSGACSIAAVLWEPKEKHEAARDS